MSGKNVQDVTHGRDKNQALQYDKARPNYPLKILTLFEEEILHKKLNSDHVILDLAAGTGKFTELLVQSPAKVFAVEPSAQMRSVLSEKLHGQIRSGKLTVLEGSGENIPLASNSLDAVFVAQAFHWFANDTALAEISRVLRKNCPLVLVNNKAARDSDWDRKFHRFRLNFKNKEYDKHRQEFGLTQKVESKWITAFEDQEIFQPSELHGRHFKQFTEKHGTIDMLVSWIMSQADHDEEEVGEEEVKRRLFDFVKCNG